jgi:hypothetical protein
MSNYVLSFRGQSDRTVTADEEAEWGGWFQQIGGSIVDFGHRVGRVSSLGTAQTDGTALGGYVVISAGNFDQAVDVAKGCPGLRHGGAVEVGEAMDMA